MQEPVQLSLPHKSPISLVPFLPSYPMLFNISAIYAYALLEEQEFPSCKRELSLLAPFINTNKLDLNLCH